MESCLNALSAKFAVKKSFLFVPLALDSLYAPFKAGLCFPFLSLSRLIILRKYTIFPNRHDYLQKLGIYLRKLDIYLFMRTKHN